jgi:nicotinamidase-related amidase
MLSGFPEIHRGKIAIMARSELPIPPHFDPDAVGRIRRVDYSAVARETTRWRREHEIAPAATDRLRCCLLLVDVQNTFCIPEFELFVAGRSGLAAVEDNRRLCRFIYRNLDSITAICPTLDTHHPFQIFHPVFLVNDRGEHPSPHTTISEEAVRSGEWRANPEVCAALGFDADYVRRHLEHYARSLERVSRYDWIIWPYHALLGGIGHALVPAVEEAVFFHSLCRFSQPRFQVKGDNPLTEHYSVLGPEIDEDPEGFPIGKRDETLTRILIEFDRIVVAGQAKSHCVAWTVEDLLSDTLARERRVAERIYLLEDCTSPVVVPGVVDFTEQADDAFRRFAEAGVRVVRSTEAVSDWPGFESRE